MRLDTRAYLLTPRGIESKATITVHFLKRKMAEYEALKADRIGRGVALPRVARV